MNLDECMEILAGACHLQMRRAIELCSNFLESELCAKTCVDILNIGETFALSKVSIHLLLRCLCNVLGSVTLGQTDSATEKNDGSVLALGNLWVGNHPF